jgi:hypothetical protein
MQEAIGAATAQADAVLLGRRTYLEFAELWPNQGSDVPMADFLNNSPKHIVSSTLDTRLFDEMTERVPLKLVESTTLSTGVLSVTYRPVSA